MAMIAIRMSRVLAVLLAFALAFAASAQRPRRAAMPRPKIEPYHKAYSEGVSGINRGLVTEGIAAMSTAINRDPRERTVLVENVKAGPYLPHYYRGVALFYSVRPCTDEELTRRDKGCDEAERAQAIQVYKLAIDAFDESERQGVIRSFPQEYAKLQSMREKAAASKRRLSNRVWDDVEARPQGAIAAFRDAVGARVYSIMYEYRGPIGAVTGFFAGIRKSFSGELDPGLTIQLSGRVTGEALIRQREQLAREAAFLRLKRRNAVATAFTHYLAAMNEKTGFLTVAITDAGNVSPGASLDEMQRAIARVENAIAEARKVIPESGAAKLPPPLLFEAAALYFAGDYSSALNLIEEQTLAEGRAAAHLVLIRAAARHALHASSSNTNSVLLDRAADDVKRCRQLDPALEPAEAFSPSFREFFARNAS